MRAPLAGPRVLLRRLREIMAEPISAQVRLDKIVVQIAANMVAEVCSAYVLRSDGVLELYASQGLKREAVHNVTLKVGQGLVGLIAADAQPLNLPDAQAHGAFAYLPETGEEIYHSFLGVPILRAGRALGVLVVQNRAHRTYTDEELEALQTIAMVLAEMIAAGDLEGLSRTGAPLDIARPVTIPGKGFCDGVGIGRVVLHEPRVVVTNLIADDAAKERERLNEALTSLRLSVDDMLARGDVARDGEHREVLEAYRMFAHDRGWVRRMEEAIVTGLTAEAAVERVQNDTRARLQRQTDPYLYERLHDFDDLANRLLRVLMGRGDGTFGKDLPADAIIVARNMGAAELLDYDRTRVRGLVLEDGTPTSHVTIVARALGIPTVGRAENVVQLAENRDAIVVDGETGSVHLRPSADVVFAYKGKIQFRAERQQRYQLLRDRPALTKDGVAVSLSINAGLFVDLPHLGESGADGIGLFRTELQFMIASKLPRISEQATLYRSVLDAAAGRPVTFRTLDIGGDKVLPYLRVEHEENPALGWRAIRFGLDRPGLFRTQIRALLLAAGGRELRVMIPMVTDVSEMVEARKLIDRELAHFDKHGHKPPHRILVGAMVEVPSLLWQLDALMTIADFVSVGTNDLFQFMTATDRGNLRVSNRFDPLSAPFLSALRSVAEAGRAANTPVTLCGEIAGQPLAAMALLALGYRSLSMAPASVGPVKAMLLALDVGRLEGVLGGLLAKPGMPDGIRAGLRAFAEECEIPV
ncbi:MAG: phosphoenolpyruvate--protein phosphotransferase [Bauldia sp.]